MTLALPSRRPIPAWVRDGLWRRARAVPSLDLRFADNKSLVDAISGRNLVTFTRSSSGTYIGSDGLLKTAATDEPRFDHNPTTGECLGLLVEEQRTNLLLNSETLSTQSVTVAAAAHTLSFTGTGTITLSGTSTAGPLVGTGTGEANRASLTFTPTAGTLTLTVSGTVSNAQLEAGAFRTSYIPTTGSAATRNADVASIAGANFSSWYRQDEGAVFVEAMPSDTSNSLNDLVRFDNGTDSERWCSLHDGVRKRGRMQVVTGGVNQVNAWTFDNDWPVNVFRRFATTVALNNSTYVITSLDESLMFTDTSCVLPAVDRTTFGKPHASVYPNACISRLVYWPQRLSNRRLHELTR